MLRFVIGQILECLINARQATVIAIYDDGRVADVQFLDDGSIGHKMNWGFMPTWRLVKAT